jgi:hypothetical protein
MINSVTLKAGAKHEQRLFNKPAFGWFSGFTNWLILYFRPKMGENVNMPNVDLENYHIEIVLFSLVELIYLANVKKYRYDTIQYKTPTVLFWDISKYNLFLLQLSVSTCFKPIVPFCVQVLPIVTPWNRVSLIETGEKSRFMFLENDMKLSIFLVKPVKNQDYVWNRLSQNYVCLSIWNSYHSKNLDLWLFTFGKQKFL